MGFSPVSRCHVFIDLSNDVTMTLDLGNAGERLYRVLGQDQHTVAIQNQKTFNLIIAEGAHSPLG